MESEEYIELMLLNPIYFATQFNVAIKQLTYHSDYSEVFIHSTRPLLKHLINLLYRLSLKSH